MSRVEILPFYDHRVHSWGATITIGSAVCGTLPNSDGGWTYVDCPAGLVSDTIRMTAPSLNNPIVICGIKVFGPTIGLTS